MALTTSTDRLTEDEVRSLAPARARIPRALAGGTRWLWELATGAPSVADERAVTPRNPDGQTGANRSGYPWGPAFRNHLWSTTGGSEGDPADVAFQRTLGTFDVGERKQWVARFRVRPFVERPLTPFSRGYLSIRCAAGSGAGTSSAVFKLARLETPDRQTSGTATTSSTTIGTQADLAFVDLRPGLNTVLITLDSVTTREIELYSLSLCQIVTRTH